MSDAVSRYLAASQANDVEALLDTLTPDAEVYSPISGRMVFSGRDDLRVLLGAVYGGLSGLRWSQPIGNGTTQVATAEASIGPIALGDVTVFELAADGRIRRMRPHVRPWLALTVFALVLGPRLLPHAGILLRALRRA